MPDAVLGAPVRVDVRLRPGEREASLRRDVLEGLTARPKSLPAKWHYDARGSELFERITRLPEYYLTRRERSILRARARDVAVRTAADTLVELGSGVSEKTRLLLDALAAAGRLQRYVPLDVDEATLRASGETLRAEYAGLEVHGVVGDFERDLEAIPPVGTRLFAFLGSTIGNLAPPDRAGFLARLAAVLLPGEFLLLGVDLVKDRRRLERAYDDGAGVTAAFSRNVLAVLNRELDANFVLERFRHEARWDAEQEWMGMLLRSLTAQTVSIRALGLEVPFEAGEPLHTEISAKFRREGVEAELRTAGLEPRTWWTDDHGDFGLALAERP